MTHPQVFGQKFTLIRRFSAWKTHPFWLHIPNMIQYGSAPLGNEAHTVWANAELTLIQGLAYPAQNSLHHQTAFLLFDMYLKMHVTMLHVDLF